MADLLQYQNSDHAKEVSSTSSSLFLHPEVHRYVMPFIEEFKLLSNVGATPSSFGSTYTFELFDNGDLVGDLWLKLVVPAVSSGTNSRFCDYGGLYCIDRVDYMHGGVVVNSLK